MRFVIFTHSLVSDWNHGNAHFLRGIASELMARQHEVSIFEPAAGWSRENLLREHGQASVNGFQERFPHLRSTLYDESTLNLGLVLRHADVVIVHEWNTPSLVAAIGKHRPNHDYKLFFHDTHHRSLTEKSDMAAYELANYDCVLAYGKVIRDSYLVNGWVRRAIIWHEAADTNVFHPLADVEKTGDLVWVGNWGDGERAESLREFLIEPVRELGLKAQVYGVRYPEQALRELADAGIEYRGWLPNYEAPAVFAQHRVTVHVPRGPYARALPGIPTIRPFEALACGIPLVSAPWEDTEHLFGTEDFLRANDGHEMTARLKQVLSDSVLADSLVSHGLNTIRTRHTCAHRVDQLFTLMESLSEAGVLQETN